MILLKAAESWLARSARGWDNQRGGVLCKRTVADHALQQDQPAAVALARDERGDGPTEREAQQYRPLQSQHRHQLSEVRHVLFHQIPGPGLVAEAVAAQIDGDDTAVGRQLFGQRGEHVGATA